MNLYEAVGVTVIIMACEFAMYAVLFFGFLLILKIVDKFFGDIEEGGEQE